ncbi:thiol reductant ABC exporter subunit CydC (plasmid) [Deinococcus aetherius]|uniref:Thiol reductant ABC exporter subunit CydC n=1 Tax=Deinococcus aetherius TaxID=200252 RepID=A0ABN6RMN1_9DEIO|nr:ATP-binding cassette domain-containing protein [Deinococcus aetherius]BDP44567.1 thiol reductant ABC exporter subunit CydC [Deinococcus aetherius]
MRGALALGVLTALAGVGLAASSGLLISRAALRPEVFLSLLLLVTTVRALGLGRAALRYAERLAGHAAALEGGERVRLRLFDTLARFGRDLLAYERSGDLLARSGADIDARQFFTLRVSLPLGAFVGVLIALGGWLAWLDPGLALLALLPLLGAALVVLRGGGRAARLAREDAHLSRDHAARLLDALSASGDGGGSHHGPELTRLTAQLEHVALETGRLAWRITLARELGFAVALSGVLWRGAALVQAGHLGGALLAAVVLGVAAAFDAAGPLAAVPLAHAADVAARERTAALEALTPGVVDPSVPRAVPPGPFALELRDVIVRRHGRAVLSDVSLRLRAGESLGISGPSGGGKTTLIRLLTRDLDPDAGQVTLNGADLRDLDLATLRARISLHEQDAPLLDGTLRENLRLGDHHAPDPRLRALLDDLGLPHLDLDTWVGEGGTRLSGGERARVSLARALLGPGDLLLLDEPTAHLDAATEARVLRVIGRERAGRALLIVTHRAAPLALTGRHLTLRSGHLHEGASVPERTAV